ncbi:unnamed protein product [Meganyctiphanes norvegica]|uniref:F5/8 type C domain-containing protein n=1 Tax=Meganyctiphanes norvegica TaxID=48144 RepID=A0AAV2SLZ6_MEGNR
MYPRHFVAALVVVVVLETCWANDVLWRKVQIDLERDHGVNLSEAAKEVVTYCSQDSNICCAMACTKQDWCELWYRDAIGDCVLTNIIVSPSYQGISPTPLICYTKRKKDLIMQHARKIYGTETAPTHPLRLVTNLINGFYRRHIANDCYTSTGSEKPWVLIDLGKEMAVREVHFIAPPNSYMAENYFRDIRIKMGTTRIINGDLRSYKLLANFTGPVKPKEIVIIKRDKPIVGRYISFQKKSEKALAICYVELF